MQIEGLDLRDLLKAARELEASDLHIVVGLPPMIRKHGKLVPLKFPSLNNAHSKSLIYSILTQAQRENLEKDLELDCGFSVPELGRYRANVYFAQGRVEGSFRVVSSEIKTIRELMLPRIIERLCEFRVGLIIITGSAGSGKTTTLNAMMNFINETKNCRIISIEDPVEYLHQHKKSIIIQREVYGDTLNFKNALV
ncbi:MAG: Flp pilus assembly complex ATPase component TadA, partial [Candidatus Omnitrophica bacterium]|nr:Flp pilus assembly complex ATPase component TadA [Candidatus Omnitrophota bacterium]